MTDRLITSEIRIGAPPSTVYGMLDSSDWSTWTRAQGGVVGTALRLEYPEGVVVGAVLAAIRSKSLLVSWGWEDSDQIPPGSTRAEFSLRRLPSAGTLLHLVHVGLPFGADEAQRHDWERQLVRLRAVAEMRRG